VKWQGLSQTRPPLPGKPDIAEFFAGQIRRNQNTFAHWYGQTVCFGTRSSFEAVSSITASEPPLDPPRHCRSRNKPPGQHPAPEDNLGKEPKHDQCGRCARLLLANSNLGGVLAIGCKRQQTTVCPWRPIGPDHRLARRTARRTDSIRQRRHHKLCAVEAFAPSIVCLPRSHSSQPFTPSPLKQETRTISMSL
jgi:hypothetical protein